MKLIFLVLIFLLILNVLLLQLFGVNLDKSFLVSLLSGLLPNIIIFFVAIFVVDALIKRIEVNKLKLLNKNQSEFVDILVGRFMLKILLYLECIKEKEYKDYMTSIPHSENIFHKQTDWLSGKVEEIQNKSAWNQILYEKIIQTKDKYEYVVKLSKLIKENHLTLVDNIKKIHPYPSPDILEITEGIIGGIGLMLAIESILNPQMKNRVNEELIEQKHKEKLTNEHVDLLLKVLLISSDDRKASLERMFASLRQISDEARLNNLFIK